MNDQTSTLPVVWSNAFVLDRAPCSWKRAGHRVIVSRPTGQSRTRCPWCSKPLAAFPSEYPDPDGKADQDAIIAMARRFAPEPPWKGWAGPVVLTVESRIAVPASWATWEREAALAGAMRPTSGRGGKGAAGDFDNLVKQIADSFTRSGDWWSDDAVIVDGRSTKVYAARPAWSVAVYFLREPASAKEWAAIKAEREAARGLFAAAGEGVKGESAC